MGDGESKATREGYSYRVGDGCPFLRGKMHSAGGKEGRKKERDKFVGSAELETIKVLSCSIQCSRWRCVGKGPGTVCSPQVFLNGTHRPNIDEARSDDEKGNFKRAVCTRACQILQPPFVILRQLDTGCLYFTSSALAVQDFYFSLSAPIFRAPKQTVFPSVYAPSRRSPLPLYRIRSPRY